MLLLTERELIAFIGRLAKRPGQRLTAGIGDDTAVWRPRPGHELLVTTDQLIEGVHYLKEGMTPRQAGARILGRGLSDIAAMGGEARLAFLSLALPAACGDDWCRSFFRGFQSVARQYRVAWAGGDLSSTPGPVAAAVTVIGDVPQGEAVLRSGARPGDRLFVSGVLGRAPATIIPRLALGRYLRRHKLATAMIDLSDGLSTDLAQLATASGVGAVVEAARIPSAGKLEQALHRGEDYELLFTAPPLARLPARAGVALTEIGRITRGRAILLQFENGRRERLEPRGWEHFR